MLLVCVVIHICTENLITIVERVHFTKFQIGKIIKIMINLILTIVGIFAIIFLVNWLDRNVFSKQKGSNKKDD